jgi:hypothetical protein
MLAAGTSGYLLKSNGAAAPTWVAPSAGGFSNMVVFGTSTTWTVPAGITKIKVTQTGGGGTTENYSGCGGAGAGGTVISIINVTPGWSINITIGAGGANPYTAGGSTTFIYSTDVIYLDAGGGAPSSSRDGGAGGAGANYSSGSQVVTALILNGGGGGGGFSDGGVGGSSFWGGGGYSGYYDNGAGAAYGSGAGGRGQSGASGKTGKSGIMVIEY